MENKPHYFGIEASTIDKLNKQIQEYAKDGYEPSGSISVAACSDENSNYWAYAVLLKK